MAVGNLLVASVLLCFSVAVSAYSTQDISPPVESLEVHGNDLVLDHSVTVPGGDLSHWPAVTYAALDAAKGDIAGCAKPKVKLPLPEYQRTFVISCSPQAIWMSSEAYCGEGLHDISSLFRIDLSSGQVQQFGWLPDCEQPAALAFGAGRIWIGTVRPVEKYRPAAASGVIGVRQHDGKVDYEGHFAGLAVKAMTASETALWALGYEGVGRLDFASSKETFRYFDFSISDDDQLVSVLAEKEPSESRAVMLEFLRHIPVRGKATFITMMARAQRQNSQYTVDNPPLQMVPFYIEAARHFSTDPANFARASRVDWDFSYLMNLIMSYRNDYRDEIVALLNDIEGQQHSSSQWQEIGEAKRGLDDPGYRPDRSKVFIL